MVDDSADLRNLISMLIDTQSDGWKVVAQAEDGLSAIEATTRTSPDLVLLDVAMPVLDGLQALPRIKDVAPNAVVVMLSAYPFAIGGQSALDAGAHAYLEKENLVTTLVPRLEGIMAAHLWRARRGSQAVPSAGRRRCRTLRGCGVIGLPSFW